MVIGSTAAEAGEVLAAEPADLPTWLPPSWQPPQKAELSTGHHLRPVRPDDVNLHLRAVLESQERLWSIYGAAWRWPSPILTVEQDRQQLARREADAEQHRSFSYGLFDLGETELLGCVDIDPGPGGGAVAAVSWWVVDWLVHSPIEWALAEFVPAWVAADWPVVACRGPVSRPTGW